MALEHRTNVQEGDRRLVFKYQVRFLEPRGDSAEGACADVRRGSVVGAHTNEGGQELVSGHLAEELCQKTIEFIRSLEMGRVSGVGDQPETTVWYDVGKLLKHVRG